MKTDAAALIVFAAASLSAWDARADDLSPTPSDGGAAETTDGLSAAPPSAAPSASTPPGESPVRPTEPTPEAVPSSSLPGTPLLAPFPTPPPPLRNHLLSISPLPLIASELRLNYEFGLTPHLSLVAGGQLRLPYNLLDDTDYDISSYGAILGAAIYPFGQRFSSLFISPTVNLLRTTVNETSVNTVAAGLDVGYRWLWSSGFTLGLGLGYWQAWVMLPEEMAEIELPSLGGPRVLFDLGVAW